MRTLTRILIPVSALTAALATAAVAQVPLQIKAQEGTATVTTAVTTKQVLTIAGMDVPTEAHVTSRSLLTTAKPAADGTQRIEEKTTGFTIKLATPAGLLEYDIEKPDPKAGQGTPYQPLIEGFNALKGLAYTLVLKDGRVTGVEGVEDALAKVPAASQESLKQQLSPEVIRKEWQQSLDVVPGKPVKKGDTWTRNEVMNIGSGQTLTFDVQYEYQDAVQKDGRTLDKVSFVFTNVKYAIEGAGLGALKVAASDLKVDQSFGHYLLDREKGTVIERASNVHITGPMTFEINGQQLPGKVDLSLDVNTTTR